MQDGSEIPPIPRWFHEEVVALFAMYPSATISTATSVAWWRKLHRLPREAIAYGFDKAPAAISDKQFCPSAAVVHDIAKAWRTPTPVGDLARLALQEPDPELPPDLADIRERQRRGDISAHDATLAFLRWTIERLP